MASQVVALGDYDDGTLKVGVTAIADGVASPTTITVGAAQLQFNAAAGMERTRANEDFTVFTSAARTANPSPFDSHNRNARGLHLVIDVTANSSALGVTFKIQGKDSISGKFYDILVSTALTSTGTTILKVFPGATAAANLAANDIIPRQFRVTATHGDGLSVTYSVGVSLIL